MRCPEPLRARAFAFLSLGFLSWGCTREAEKTAVSSAPFAFVDATSDLQPIFLHDNGFDGKRFRVAETINGGVALLDYDRDGRLDIFFTNANRLEAEGQPARCVLYNQTAEGKFEDVSKAAGVDDDGFSFGCSVADITGDGFPEILVTRWGANRLYKCRGDGTFVDIANEAGVAGNAMQTGSAFLDMDRDGDLDLYVASYAVDAGPEFPPLIVRGVTGYWPPRNYAPAPHHLYENLGEGKYVDVSEKSGIRAVSDPGRGLGVVAADFNSDGNADLYVANDMSANFMFLGDGKGRFQEAGFVNGTALGDLGEELGSMGIAVGDYDGDAALDLCVTNYQNQVNNFYRGGKSGVYEDLARVVGISEGVLPEVSWGVGFADFDQDGWLDLFIGNGHLNPYTQQMDQSTSYAQPKVIFRNLQGRKFQNVSKNSGAIVVRPAVVRGAAFGDLDNDGDVDIVLVNTLGPAEMLRNETIRPGAWAQVRLQGADSNRDAVGARVTIRNGDKVQIVERMSSSSYLSVNDPRLHFGLGQATQIDHLEVRWPRGHVSTYSALPVRKLLVLSESTPDHVAEDLIRNLPRPTPGN